MLHLLSWLRQDLELGAGKPQVLQRSVDNGFLGALFLNGPLVLWSHINLEPPLWNRFVSGFSLMFACFFNKMEASIDAQNLASTSWCGNKCRKNYRDSTIPAGVGFCPQIKGNSQEASVSIHFKVSFDRAFISWRKQLVTARVSPLWGQLHQWSRFKKKEICATKWSLAENAWAEKKNAYFTERREIWLLAFCEWRVYPYFRYHPAYQFQDDHRLLTFTICKLL